MHETVTPALFAISASRGRWVAANHLLLLSDKLTQVAAGSLKRLMVFMPPRPGKSQLISQYFPAWYLGHHPDNRIILTSYEADGLAVAMNGKMYEVREANQTERINTSNTFCSMRARSTNSFIPRYPQRARRLLRTFLSEQVL